MKNSLLKKWLFGFVLLFIYSNLSGQLVGRVFKDDCYKGSYQWMYPGSYNKNNLSFGNDKISSIYMYSNRHFIRLFEDDTYRGEYRDIYYHMNDLNTIDFEDETSSIKVLPSTTTLPTANEEVISAYALSGNSINYVNQTTFTMPRNRVGYVSRIHMQGLGRNKAGNRIVLTGCVASGPTSGCTGTSYIFLFDNNGNFIDVTVPPRVNGQYGGESHPSSIQMIGNVFPVAVAEETGQYGPTVIKFFTIDNDQIREVNGAETIQVNDHIGTVAYANINGDTYLIGGTWGSSRIYVWKASGEGKSKDFDLITANYHPFFMTNRKASIDENWGAYNSFWLGKMKEDGRVVLFATHGPIGIRSWADIWEVNNIGTPYGIRVNKIHKRWKDRFTTNRPYFLEGTYPAHRPGNTPDILAFPDDFKIPSNSYNLTSTLFRLRYGIKNCGGSHPRTGPDTEPTVEVKQEDLKGNLQMTISPNPVATKEITVYLEGLAVDANNVSIQIFDAKGQLIREVTSLDMRQTKSQNIDVSDFAKGLYSLRAFAQNGQIVTGKFIRQ